MALSIKKAKTSHLLLAALFVFSFLLRISLISKGPYHSDCLYLALQSQKIVLTHQMHYLHGLGFPLTALTSAFFIGTLKFFGITDPVWCVNFMSTVFGALDVVVLYLCVEKLFGPRAAFYGGLFLSINPLFLALSTFGNTHVVAVFFFLAGLYFLLTYVQQSSGRHLVLGGIFLGFFGATRLQDLMVMSLPLFFLILFPPAHLATEKTPHRKKGEILRDLLLLASACLITLALFYYPRLTANKDPLMFHSFYASVKRHFLDYLLAPSVSLIFKRFAAFFSNLSPVEWLVTGFGLGCLFKKDLKLCIFLFLSIFLYFFLFGNLIFAIERHFTLALIPVVIIESYVLSLLPKKTFFWRAGIPAAFIVLLILNLTHYYPTLAFRHNNAWLPDFFTWVGQQTEPESYVIERDHSFFIEHYARRKPFNPAIKLYAQRPEILEQFKEDLDSLLKQGIPVYITKYGILYRPRHHFREFMIEHYRFEYIGTRPIEDWHKGCLKQILVNNDLLRVRPLAPSPSS